MKINKYFLSITKNSLVFLFTLCFLSCATMDKSLSIFNEEKEDEASSYMDHYFLGVDDVIRVNVEQHPEWSGEFVIDPSGRISIPGLNDIFAGSLLKEELAANLANHLEQYINNPRVTVEIVKYASQVIYVFGEVNRPGKYSTEGKIITIRDAILNAGLVRSYADLRRVFIISSSKKRNPSKKVINLYRIMYRGELEKNIVLKPGDIVYVPQTVLGKLVDFLSSLTSPFSSVSAAKSAVMP
ncbi:polysaccharide biosynthesis/export family protein [Elusimicrobiota bacterium]